MNHLLYWKIRYIFGRITFVFKKHFYKISITGNKTKLSFSLKRSLFKEVFKHLLLNALLFAVTVGIDSIIFYFLKFDIEINKDLLSDILIAMVGVAGVF